MSGPRAHHDRRQFLKTALGAGAALALPHLVPAAALGKNGRGAPSEQIVLGGIGIGNRGSYDLGCFLQQPDVRFVAVCDVKAERREAVKTRPTPSTATSDCATYRDLRELLARGDIDAVLIATGPNWHATAADPGGQGRQGRLLREALHEEHRAEPGPGRDVPPHGPRLPGRHAAAQPAHFAFAVDLARRGKLGKLQTVYAHPGGLATATSGWRPAEPEPPKEQVDWDLYLGPAAWRPFNHGAAGRL